MKEFHQMSSTLVVNLEIKIRDQRILLDAGFRTDLQNFDNFPFVTKQYGKNLVQYIRKVEQYFSENPSHWIIFTHNHNDHSKPKNQRTNHVDKVKASNKI